MPSLTIKNLPPGLYRLYVTRYSYRPYSVVVELRGDAGTGVERAPSAAIRLGDRMSKETFRMIVLVVLGGAAIRLIWSVL